MKRLISSPSLRGLVECFALFLAFGLGVYCGNQRTVPESAAKGSKPPGGFPASSMLATTDTLAAPALSQAPVAPPLFNTDLHSRTTPSSRLAALIGAAAGLNEPQAIASLRQLDLRPDGLETKLQRHVLLAHFAEIDPQTALTYVDTLSGGEHDEQTANVYATWASRDPQAAAARFQSEALNGGLASTQDRDTAAAIASEWSHSDPKGALAWTSSLPEEIRSEARSRIITTLAADNPAQAAQAISNLPVGYERADAMKPLAAQWAQTTPDRAAVWVRSLSNPADQASAATGLVSSWASTDPMAASRWVSNLPKGQSRDAAISSLVRAQSLLNDPEAATLWANSVQNRNLRQQLVAEASRRWQMQDATAATAWIQANQ